MKWIDIRDELPSHTNTVLVCESYDPDFEPEYAIAWYSKNKKWVACSDMIEASNYDGGAHITIYGNVTHWAELTRPSIET